MDPIQQHYWLTPAVRHLAWVCTSGSLVLGGPALAPRELLTPDAMLRLRELDTHPAPLLDHLANLSSHRLGHYFEALYDFLLARILGWQVLLRNAPVRTGGGQTLGELDFIVRNPATGMLEHHEVAIKYYLGYRNQDAVADPTGFWFGPNARDRLDLKFHHMMGHQCQMATRPEARAMLAANGLDEPVTPRLIMPGNLFHPFDVRFRPDLPAWANPDHERGYWIYHHTLTTTPTEHWVVLNKPDWLGPFQCRQAPDPAVTQPALDRVAQHNRPALFARMALYNEGYQEIERWFVVPGNWPQREAATHR